MKQRLHKALPHLCIMFSIAALALAIIDHINSQMGFLSSTPGRVVLAAASVLNIINAARQTLRIGR